jgi:hypothetical protein
MTLDLTRDWPNWLRAGAPWAAPLPATESPVDSFLCHQLFSTLIAIFV